MDHNRILKQLQDPRRLPRHPWKNRGVAMVYHEGRITQGGELVVPHFLSDSDVDAIRLVVPDFKLGDGWLGEVFGFLAARSIDATAMSVPNALAAVRSLVGGGPSSPPKLGTKMEEDIVDAVRELKDTDRRERTGEKVAKRAGYEYNGRFKETLSALVKRDILANENPGYRER